MADVEVHLDHAAIEALGRGPEMLDHALSQIRPIVDAARRAAPVSRTGSHGRAPGYLQRNIHERHGVDSDGLFVDVVSAAQTPDGFPYGRVQEARRPYIRPQLEGREGE